jgi:hypothetical protein
VDVKANVVGGRFRGRDGLHGVGLCGERGDIEIGADGEARDEHVAGEQQVILRALQVQRGIGQRTYPVRIADADSRAGDREVSVDAVLIGQITAHAEQAAAAHGGEGFYIQPVLVELERAVQLAQAVGHVLQRQ